MTGSNLPTTSPSKRDDEMDPSQYEFPPGLMPETDETYLHIDDGEYVTIYENGSPRDVRVVSDVHWEVFR